MGGILLYVYFLIVGFLYANELFREKNIYFRAWMGGVFGNVILMAGIVIPSLIFGFTVLGHIVLVILALVPYAVILARSKEKKGFKDKFFMDNENSEVYIDTKVFCALIIPISLIIWVLMTNHILAPLENGGVSSGQSTYGDLHLHLSFVTSIAEQHAFPPDYSIMPGHIIGYPFFVDMLSSSLFLFGTPVRWAVLIPSYVISMLLVMGFYTVAFTLTQRKAAAVLATVLFFFNGGLGLIYFLDGAKADHSVFTRIFTGYYTTPTNFRGNEGRNICWVNTVCDMIIPQRTTMAGWCVFQPLVWLLVNAVKTKERKLYIILGVLSGTMLMIHTHTLLAFAMICAVMFFAYLIGEKSAEDKKKYFINWVIFGAITAVMVMPQLFMWTMRQAGSGSFMKLHFNWENKVDPYLWFYIKNWGIAALFAVPAVLCAKKDNKKLIAGCALVFAAGELILFQPLEYDNNKIFFIAYMILLILIADWLLMMWDKLKGMRGRAYLAVLVIIAGTASGTLTMCREYYSGVTKDGKGRWQVYSADDLKMADYIRENVPSNARILTGTQLLNPVYSLSGRDIYLGPANFISTHGMGREYSSMESRMKSAFKGSYNDMKKFCDENGISYVYVGPAESNDLKPNAQMLSQLEEVFKSGRDTLYKVK